MIIINVILIVQEVITMEYKIPVTKENIHKTILTAISFTLGLSELEIDILSTLLKHNLYVVDTKAKEVLIKTLNKSKFQINNYITRLRKKKLVIQASDDKKWYLNPNLKPIIESENITFKFNISDGDN